MASTTAKLRSLLRPGGGVLIPGASNALAARMIEAAGFDMLMLTGAGLANTHLGAPDIGLTTMIEVADTVAAMREAVDIPILVDADTGFGNALNIHRTVRSFERAGADAIQVEDQVFPKRCGHFEGKEVVSKAEMVLKLKAASDARRGDMMILARTDARAVEGLQGALERAEAYREAGADMIFVEAPQSIEELAEIPQKVKATHICNMVFGGKTPLLPRKTLAAMGYAGIQYANAALQASMLAMQKILSHLRTHGSLEGAESTLISFADRQEIVEHKRYQEMEKRYTQK